MKRFHIKYFESIYILIIILFFAGCGGGKHKETVSIFGKFVFFLG